MLRKTFRFNYSDMVKFRYLSQLKATLHYKMFGKVIEYFAIVIVFLGDFRHHLTSC